jgi:hypothetical protein
VALAAGQGEEHLEDERFQRKMRVDVLAAGPDHGGENSVRMILVSSAPPKREARRACRAEARSAKAGNRVLFTLLVEQEDRR